MSTVIRTLLVKVGADLTKFDRSMKAMNRKMTKTGKMMVSAGSAMTRGLTLPILALGVASTKMGKEFEASMSKIVGLVGVAQDQVDAWGKDILEMAPKLGKAPQELADGLFYVTSAGLRGAQAMDVLEKSAKGSASGLGEVAQIADLVTSAMNAYGIENLSASKTMDVLTGAVRAGKFEASALAPVLGNLLPMASKLNISFSQISGTLAVMSRTGMEATTSATSLNSVMLLLQKPTDEARKMLNDVGITMADLRDLATKQPDGLIQVMRLLNDTFEDDDEALATLIPNIRALKGTMNILAQDASIVDQVMSDVTNSTGLAEEAFKTASETAEFKWQQAIVSVQTALVSLWDTLKKTIVPIMEKVTSGIQDLTYKFNNLSDEQKDNIVKWAGILASIGPVLLIVGKLLIAIPKLQAGIALLGGPIALAIGAFIALGLATVKVTKDFRELQSTIRSTTRENIKNINEQRDESIQAFRLITEAQKSELEAQLADAKSAHDQAIRDIVQFRTDSIAEEKTRLSELIEGAEEANDERVRLIREEYGVMESTTKSKMQISHDYYDGIKKDANDAYTEAVRLIDQELAFKLDLLDEETKEAISVTQQKIDDINDLTKAEEQAIKDKATADKQARLEDAVERAYLVQDKKDAQAELDEFLEEENRKTLLAQREEEIASLEQKIQEITETGESQSDILKEQAETDKTTAEGVLTWQLGNIETKRDASILALETERLAVESENESIFQSELLGLQGKLTLVELGTSAFITALDVEVADLKTTEGEKYAVLVTAHNAKVALLDEYDNRVAQSQAREAGVAVTAEKAIETQAISDTMTFDNATNTPLWQDLVFGPVLSKLTTIPNLIDLFKFKADEQAGSENSIANSFDKVTSMLDNPPGFNQENALSMRMPETKPLDDDGLSTNSRGDVPAIIVNAVYNVIDKATAEFANNDLTSKMVTRGVTGGMR